jgi:hypothetical protein
VNARRSKPSAALVTFACIDRSELNEKMALSKRERT